MAAAMTTKAITAAMSTRRERPPARRGGDRRWLAAGRRVPGVRAKERVGATVPASATWSVQASPSQ